MLQSSLMRDGLRSLCIASVVLVVACGEGGDKKSSQVAAKVNRDDITVHQLNFAIQGLSGNLSDAQMKNAQREVLNRLVDQQLLVQQAVNQKLDRDPQVVLAIEAARRQVLAQAYVQKVIGSAGKAAAESVKGFYDQHPELFSERRIYRFMQMAIALPADKRASVQSKLEQLDKSADKTKILSQLADWLKEQNLQFRANQVTQAAEQLPLEALPKYQKLSVGDLIVQPADQGLLVAQLTAVQTVPMTQEQATPFIEQYLQNRERLQLSDEEMKRLRAAAKIEYIGEFAKAQPQPAQQGANLQPTSPPSADAKDDVIQRGLQGLKK